MEYIDKMDEEKIYTSKSTLGDVWTRNSYITTMVSDSLGIKPNIDNIKLIGDTVDKITNIKFMNYLKLNDLSIYIRFIDYYNLYSINIQFEENNIGIVYSIKNKISNDMEKVSNNINTLDEFVESINNIFKKILKLNVSNI
jgi:hypothetical protein